MKKVPGKKTLSGYRRRRTKFDSGLMSCISNASESVEGLSMTGSKPRPSSFKGGKRVKRRNH